MRVSLLCLLAASSASAFSPSVALLGKTAARSSSLSLRRSAAAFVGLQMAEMSPTDKAKQLAGYKSVDDHVTSGMVVGLGTGSTAYFAVERVGQKLASGELKDIICIPTSERTREQAESLKIPLCTLNEKSNLDVAIDGADAVDPDYALIKGGGGALLREKMVEVMAKKFICIVDDSKLCKGLGPSFPLPVEITPFCHEHTMRTIQKLPELEGGTCRLRTGDSSNNKVEEGKPPAVTDNGNYIVDVEFKHNIKDVPALAKALKNTVGVVDHGLFVGMTYREIIFLNPQRKLCFLQHTILDAHYFVLVLTPGVGFENQNGVAMLR